MVLKVFSCYSARQCFHSLKINFKGLKFSSEHMEVNIMRVEKKRRNVCYSTTILNSCLIVFALHLRGTWVEVPTLGHLPLAPELSPTLYLTASSHWTAVFLPQTIKQFGSCL